MEHNNLQSNLSYNAPFAPNTALNIGQQQGAQPQARPVPPLESAPDLSAPVSPRGLQNYRTSRPLEEEPDTFNLPEYQPIKPGEPHMQKLADEAANTRKIERSLKHAQECEADGDFQDAEKAYKQALKFTESAEHYKRYAACLKNISASSKDEVKEKIYKEKSAKAFYFLGELYTKQGALQEAQAAYKTSCELACHEIPLQALVAVSRQLGEKGDIVEALEKLADFYAGKGKIDLAIKILEEALQVEKSFTILQKLEVLCGQAGGDGSQLKVNELAIRRFELRISEDPKNIGLYRDYAWFLKDIERKSEARAVKKRMDELLQKKLIKQKAKMGGFKQTIHSQTEIIHHLQTKIQAQAEILANLSTKLETNTSKSSKDIDGLQKKVISLENEKLPAQAKKLELTIIDFNQKISSQAGGITNLAAKVETNAAKSSKDIGDLQKTFEIFEKEKLSAQAKKLELTITDFNQKISSQAGGITNLAAKVETNAAKSSKDIDVLQKTFEIFEKEKLPAQAKKLELTITDFNQKISSKAGDIAKLEAKVETNAAKSSKEIDVLQKTFGIFEKEKFTGQVKSIHTLNTQLDSLGKQIQAHTSKTDEALEGIKESLEFSKMTSLSFDNLCNHPNYEPRDEDIIPLLHTNPNLKYLSLQSTRFLTNAVLAIIPERFGNLEYLNVARSDGMTSVASWNGMTLAGLSAMIDRLPRLRRLLYYKIDGTAQEHQALIRKLNARRIVHAGLN